MKKLLVLFLSFALTLSLVACGEEEETEGGIYPEVLEVQLIPSRDAEALNEYVAPLEALLEVQLGMDVNVTVATDYNALIEGMSSGQIHVGLLATTSYVLAHDEGAANVILKSLRYDVNDAGEKLYDEPLVSGYKSQLLVHKDSGITELSDLKGKTIAISSFTSTSGFVWPANLLADNDIDPENDVTWYNAGGHDNAILAVLNGDADAAFTFKDARFLVETEHPNVYDDVLFLLNTESIPNDTISVIPGLDPELVQMIKDAFINIAASDFGLQVIQDIYSHEGYAEATDEEYDVVREYLRRQEDWEFGN
jgi:phosphonate transport system substrate-binding protein